MLMVAARPILTLQRVSWRLERKDVGEGGEVEKTCWEQKRNVAVGTARFTEKYPTTQLHTVHSNICCWLKRRMETAYVSAYVVGLHSVGARHCATGSVTVALWGLDTVPELFY